MSDGSAVRRDSKTEKRTSPVTFYRQVVAELRKVVWPTQEQLVTYFLVVMVFVLVMMAFVSALDLAFGKLVFALFAGSQAVGNLLLALFDGLHQRRPHELDRKQDENRE